MIEAEGVVSGAEGVVGGAEGMMSDKGDRSGGRLFVHSLVRERSVHSCWLTNREEREFVRSLVPKEISVWDRRRPDSVSMREPTPMHTKARKRRISSFTLRLENHMVRQNMAKPPSPT